MALGWQALPADIRLMILETIAAEKHPGWASSAAVCREWQAVLARENLARIELSSGCLDAFERAIVRQRGLVRHVWLNVELPRYSCQFCGRLDSRNRMACINAILGQDIAKVFAILSTWEPGQGLTLEFNAFCPSDTEHWFKDLFFASDCEAHCGSARRPLRQQLLEMPQWHDPSHGWHHGHQTEHPPLYSMSQLFEWLDLRPRGHLPPVPAVARFVVRRQLRRWLSVDVVQQMLASLVALEHFVYEPWRHWFADERKQVDQDVARLLLDSFPPSVQSITLFEDFTLDFFHRLRAFPVRDAIVQTLTNRTADPGLAAAFARRSQRLRHLAVSYMLRAEDFFRACAALPGDWDRLESLALTSPLLHAAADPAAIDALLHAAGLAARRMPRLRTLALWYGQRNSAYAFVFRTGQYYATIRQSSSWPTPPLSPRVQKAWEQVCIPHNGFTLQTERVSASIWSHGDAIFHLDLPCRVVEPVSLWQIRIEEAAGIRRLEQDQK